MLKLVSVQPSPSKTKKWRAMFSDGTHTDFGAKNMESYVEHHDKERRRLYRIRHAKDLDTKDPKRAGFLAYYILWGDSIRMQTNVASYNKSFFI